MFSAAHSCGGKEELEGRGDEGAIVSLIQLCQHDISVMTESPVQGLTREINAGLGRPIQERG